MSSPPENTLPLAEANSPLNQSPMAEKIPLLCTAPLMALPRGSVTVSD
jgi:hypothetical protein